MPLFAGVPDRLSVDPPPYFALFTHLHVSQPGSKHEFYILGSETKSWTWGWLMREP